MKTRIALVATVVVAAATLAPTGLAKPLLDRGGPGAIAPQQASPLRPDDRAGLRGPGAYASQHGAATSVRPDDRAGMRGPGDLTSSVVQSTSTGFDWGDALIGGLGGMGSALLLMGLLFIVAGRKSRARVA